MRLCLYIWNTLKTMQKNRLWHCFSARWHETLKFAILISIEVNNGTGSLAKFILDSWSNAHIVLFNLTMLTSKSLVKIGNTGMLNAIHMKLEAKQFKTFMKNLKGWETNTWFMLGIFNQSHLLKQQSAYRSCCLLHKQSSWPIFK